MKPTALLGCAILALVARLGAHPGSGIAVDGRSHVFFTDTGKGIWEVSPHGAAKLVSTSGIHWLGAISKGIRVSLPRRWFERIDPEGSNLALVLGSDFPFALGQDGDVVYADTRPPTTIVRRTSTGIEERIAGGAVGPNLRESEDFHSITGVTVSPDGTVYVMDVDKDSNAHAIVAVTPEGKVRVIAKQFLQLSQEGDQLTSGDICRGIVCDTAGALYIAATRLRSIVRIDSNGKSQTILRSSAPWSPTGIAIAGSDLYVLEYTDTPVGADGSDRTVWVPRVRKVDSAGRVSTVVTIRR